MLESLSRKNVASPISPAITPLSLSLPPIDLVSTINGLDPTQEYSQLKTNVNQLCKYIADYELTLSEGIDIYLKSKSLLDTRVDATIDLGYKLLLHLVRHQNVPQDLRIDAYHYTRTLQQPVHKLRRPSLYSELLQKGANIDGVEQSVLRDLTVISADSLDLKRYYDNGHLQGAQKDEWGLSGIDVTPELFRTAYHQSLQLLAAVIRFGPSVGTKSVPFTIAEILRFMDTAPPPAEDDILNLLRVYDALITRAEVPTDSLKTIVKALCMLHGYSTMYEGPQIVQKVEQTFRWLFNTHLQDEIMVLLIQTARMDCSGIHITTQEADGALQLLGTILADRNYPISTSIALETLLHGFVRDNASAGRPSLEKELDLFQLFVRVDHLQQKLVDEPNWDCVCNAITSLHGRITGEQGNRAHAAFHEILSRLDILPGIGAGQRLALDNLFLQLAPDLPYSLADKLLSTYDRPIEASACAKEMNLIKRGFIDNAVVPSSLRLAAADLLQSTCLEAQQKDPVQGRLLADLILDALTDHDSDTTLQARLVQYSLDYEVQTASSEEGFFEAMVFKMATAAERSAASTASTTPNHRRTSTRHITSALVTLFMRNMNTHPDRAQLLYRTFLQLLDGPGLDPAATVMLLRGLFRLRSDVHHHIFLIESPEGEGLAAALCRSMPQLSDSRRQSRASTISENGPVWMYGEIKGLQDDPPTMVSPVLFSKTVDEAGEGVVLELSTWLDRVIYILEHGADWEVYSYVIVHLGAQLTNQSLFSEVLSQVRKLRSLICRLLLKQSFQKPLEGSELKQADVAVCLYHILTMLIGYHDHFTRAETEEMISTFIMGMTAWDRTTVHCVHALTLCCYELPESLKRDLARIVAQMSTIVTKSDAAVHVLEFLTGLSRLKDLAKTFHGEEIKTVFGVCFSYIEYVRGKRFDDLQQQRKSTPVNRTTATPVEIASNRSATVDIPQYVFAMAYHVIIFWYISVRDEDREKYFPWMQHRLLSIDQAGKREDQALVTLDLVWRMTRRNIRSTSLLRPDPTPADAATWTSPFSLITVSVDSTEHVAQVVERRASGTDEWLIPLEGTQSLEQIFDAHLRAPADRPFPNGWDPAPLIESDASKRAISMLDRVSPVDFFKAGVMYIGEDQSTEADILANLMGSADYRLMLEGLGVKLPLLGLQHNTCGLDTSEAQTDGTKTIWHRGGVTALVYHVSTMMPTNLEFDPQCTRKKAHIGNDYVNIIFNNSGSAFDFSRLNALIPSAFNYVYVVVAPEARATFIETRTHQHQEGWFENSWFKVQVLTRQDFPNISSAAETKVVSGGVLAKYVRNLALNACVFANVWANREGGDTPSSWRARLMQLRALKERFGKKEEETQRKSEDTK
ncbi:hypothetical protein MBLNU457_2000t1 [Dothideomycetes sp. NU457]